MDYFSPKKKIFRQFDESQWISLKHEWSIESASSLRQIIIIIVAVMEEIPSQHFAQNCTESVFHLK